MNRMRRIIAGGLFVASLFPGVVRAGWIQDGIPLTPTWGSAGYSAVAPDGASGAIVAFHACHAGVTKILAQRIDAYGTVLWPSGGIELGTGRYPAIISDGAGGVIVAWESDRGAGLDIYAQRIDAGGAPLWTENGVVVCSASEDQSSAIICTDASGGAVIGWFDYSGGDTALFAQRVDADGLALWAANGVPVCSASGQKFRSSIASLGAGGAVMIWEDYRDASYKRIFAQRLDASGAAQWTANGIAVCPFASSQGYARVTADGTGGAIVAWEDRRLWSDIYAQRIDASGSLLWSADGVRVCDSSSGQTMPCILGDGAGGAIVALANGSKAISAQRIDASGAVQWSSTGISVWSGTGDVNIPSLVSDGSGGAIVIWADVRNGDFDIYAQRLDASGNVQWTPEGVVVAAAPGDQSSRWIVSDDAGGAVITWHTSEMSGGLHAQRISGVGGLEWAAGGVTVTPDMPWQHSQVIASNGSGGSIVAWVQQPESINDPANADIRAQAIDGSGNILWGSEGIAVCAAPGEQVYPAIASDGAGGAIIAWSDERDGSTEIYAQRIDGAGSALWPADGVRLCFAAGYRGYPRIMSDGAGGAIVAWLQSGSGWDLGAQRVDASGALLWGSSGVVICNASRDQSGVEMAPDGAGGAILAWSDERSGSSYDLYAQRVNALGTAQWGTNGRAVCTSAGDQRGPHVAVDEGGWSIIAWTDDQRDGAPDVYAQRLNASGALQWPTRGVPMSTAAGSQGCFAVLSDEESGAIIAWGSAQEGEFNMVRGIYVGRVSPAGAILWTTAASVGWTDAGNGVSFAACGDGAGGMNISWHEYRDASTLDVYAQSVDVNGAVRWGAGGTPISTAQGAQWFPCMSSDGLGGAMIAWRDSRCPGRIHAQRVTSLGEIIATTLKSYAAVQREGSIRLEWTLSAIDGDAVFSVMRSSLPQWEFEQLGEVGAAANRFSFSFTDESCQPGSTYRYRVDYRSADGVFRTLFETEDIAVAPIPMTLYQNYPNPFNPITEIRFFLPEKGAVSLSVYDASGRRVALLADEVMEKGLNVVRWNGSNGAGDMCASGVYFYRLQAGKESITRKLVLLR